MTVRTRKVILSLVSENPAPIENGPKNNLGESLVNIGNKIKEFSDQEIPNKQVIAGLSVVGATIVCVDVGASIHGEKMIDLATTLDKFAQVAISTGHHGAAVDFLTDEISARNAAVDAFTLASVSSFLLASEVATIAGIEIPKTYMTGKGLLDIDGKTKISTIGSALGNLFIKVGDHFNKK